MASCKKSLFKFKFIVFLSRNILQISNWNWLMQICNFVLLKILQQGRSRCEFKLYVNIEKKTGSIHVCL